MQNLTKPNGLCQMTELLNSNEAHLDYQKPCLVQMGEPCRCSVGLGACHLPQPEGVLFIVLFREGFEKSLGFGTALHLPYSILKVLSIG